MQKYYVSDGVVVYAAFGGRGGAMGYCTLLGNYLQKPLYIACKSDLAELWHVPVWRLQRQIHHAVLWVCPLCGAMLGSQERFESHRGERCYEL